MKKILIILTLILGLCGCSDTSSNQDIKKIMEENEYVIIDVRTVEEYKESHLVGAINIPYDEINKNVELDKNKVIFVYCKSGTRSEIAYNNLKTSGYTVYDLGAFSLIDLPKV